MNKIYKKYINHHNQILSLGQTQEKLYYNLEIV